MKKIMILGLVLVTALAIGAPVVYSQQQDTNSVTNQWQCPRVASQGGTVCPRWTKDAQGNWQCPGPRGAMRGGMRSGRGCPAWDSANQQQPAKQQ